MVTLTPRKMEIMRFIRDYRRRTGFSPTMQEIGDQLGLTKVTVFEHIGDLEERGLLQRGAKHHARSLRVSPRFQFPDERPTVMALVGRIAAGLPIEALEDRQVLDLETMFPASSEKFVLQVTGESMIDDHIRDGDFVVCEKRTNPRNGETVVALLEDGEATLKRFYKDGARIRLQPANPNFKPILVEPGKINIQGVVIGVVRKV
jgi:repressor LexA